MIIGSTVGGGVGGGIIGGKSNERVKKKMMLMKSGTIFNEFPELPGQSISFQVNSAVGSPNFVSIRKTNPLMAKATAGSRSATLTPASSTPSTESKTSLSRLAPLEAILFDLDGTLCDSDAVNIYAFRKMLMEMGYNDGVPISEDFFTEHISGKNTEAIARSLFPDWDIEKAMKWMDEKDVLFRRLATEHLEPINGLQKLCKWVESHGLKSAVVTNSTRINAELMISEMGLDKFFDVLVVGDECERAKPHPDPYLKALEVLNVSPKHTFIFEDSDSGTKSGVAAGMPVVGLTTRNKSQTLLDAGATFVIKDYKDPKLWMALEELDSGMDQ